METDPLKPLVDAVAGRPLAMIGLAATLLLPKGRETDARRLCEEALALAPADPEVRSRAQSVLGYGIGSWYFTMVQDERRHRLYRQAFEAVIRPGALVLDIGAGTGLFAMMAARAGAGLVVGFERNPAVAAAAQRTVERNGLSSRVRIHAGDVLDARIGVELPGPADVLVWDNLSNNLLGAGGPETVADARRRLLRPDAAVIPMRTEIRVALADIARKSERRMNMVEGFDLSAFNALGPSVFTPGHSRVTPASDAATIFDIPSGPAPAAGGRATVTATGGRVSGVAQWLRFHLADGISYDTDAEDVIAFGIEVHPVEPFVAAPGEAVAIEGAHDGRTTWFWVRR